MTDEDLSGCVRQPAVRKRIAPLQARTMSLAELQRRTLKVLQLVRKQFNRLHWEDGLTDTEFVEQVIEPFAATIRHDRELLKTRGDAK